VEKLTKVQFTNLDKVLFPQAEITKGKMIEYYVRIAPKVLNILKDRPVNLKRFPNGIDKDGFFEQDAPIGTPPWVKIFKRYSASAKRYVGYIVCNDLDTIAWIANLAAVEIHMSLSRTFDMKIPDFAFFDIDPEPPLTFDDTAAVTLLVKEKLDALGLVSFVKTSGKKGLHVLVPIDDGFTYKQTRDFVHKVGIELSKESDIIVSELSRSKERGTVFIDYLQNATGKTMIAPYSLRAAPGATVSTPLEWGEVKKGIRPDEFTISTVAKRGDPWKGIFGNKQKIGS